MHSGRSGTEQSTDNRIRLLFNRHVDDRTDAERVSNIANLVSRNALRGPEFQERLGLHAYFDQWNAATLFVSDPISEDSENRYVATCWVERTSSRGTLNVGLVYAFQVICSFSTAIPKTYSQTGKM